jgi:septal ring-binding cell division protein DamX
MSSSQRKKSLYLVLGLMILFLLGLLWHAGMLFQGSVGINGEPGRMDAKTQAIQPGSAIVTKKISAPVSGEAAAADEKTPTAIRKTLPPTPPTTPKSEPAPAPTPPTPVPTTVGQEKPQEPQAPPTPPPVAEALPAPEVSKDMPKKPIEAKPAETPPPAAPAAPVSARKQPEPTRAVAKMEKSAPGSYPFSLLLCSHRIHKNAWAMQPNFERKGLAPYIVYTDLGEKGKWWRTLLGHYKNYKEALQAIKELNLDDVVAVKTPFANLLGDHPSEKDATGAAARFAAKGLFPYVAKSTGNAARLLVGAYPTQAEAEQQQRELQGMGIAARVIQR